MKKFLFGVFVMIFLLSSFAYAGDGCFIDENCTWYAYGVYDETGVNISFIYPNGSTSQEYSMVADGLDIYYYTAVHSIQENILGCATSFNSTDRISTSCESKQIYLNTNEELDMIANVLQPFLLAIIGISIVAVGQFLATPILITVGGIWFIGLASSSFLGLIPVSIPGFGNLFLAMLGLLFIWLGIEEYLNKRN